MATLDFEMFRGNTRRITVTVVDDAGAPIPLTGLTGAALRYEIAVRADDPAIVAKDLDDGIELIAGDDDNVCRVTLAPADTAGIFGDYHNELRLVEANGDVATLAAGTVTIHNALIRA